MKSSLPEEIFSQEHLTNKIKNQFLKVNWEIWDSEISCSLSGEQKFNLFIWIFSYIFIAIP